MRGKKKSAGCRVLIIPSHQGCDPRMSTQKIHHFLNPGRTAGNLGFGGGGAPTLFIQHSPSAYPYRVLITHTTLLALQILPGPNLPPSQFSVHQMPGRQVGRGSWVRGCCADPLEKPIPRQRCSLQPRLKGPMQLRHWGPRSREQRSNF